MMMMLHGYSGVGKTTVINEVHKPLVRVKVRAVGRITEREG